MIIMIYCAAMNYLLRDVDSELWRRVKVQAAKEGAPIRSVLIRLLREYVSRNPKVRKGGHDGKR